MSLEDAKYVWIPDNTEGFLLAVVKHIDRENISIQIKGRNEVIEGPRATSKALPGDDDLTRNHEDNCELLYLNEATLLQNTRLRYMTDNIYTYVANILIAVNPYHAIPNLYTKETMEEYKGVSLGILPPHLFAIADKTYRDMKMLKQSQSIVVSGESGSGKTETTKYIIRYITETYGTGRSGDIERQISESSPLLEAFGNAKTLRNLNSSRFGKYIEVHFDKQAKIMGAFISHYLLEKTRVVSQSTGERNYHVFYRLCTGAPEEVKEGLKLDDPCFFNYLKYSSYDDPNINDTDGFEILDNAINDVGITDKQKSNIFRIVSLVLHLGNIEFPSCTESATNIVAELMGVPARSIREGLSNRNMVTVKEKLKVKLSPEQSAASRDGLAKSIYSKLFDYIVGCVNKCFKNIKTSSSFIGVLDIAGFEVFEVNGFEQFCINYCNEKLQQFFNDRILKEEQELYRLEGLRLKQITFMDNADCLELFELKNSGIMHLVDEEMKLPTPSDDHFTEEVHRKNDGHFRLGLPRKYGQKNLKDNEAFVIRHFAGAVCYNTDGFLARNNDALHEDLEKLLQESSDPFIRNLFPPPAPNGKKDSKKLTFESIGKKFRSQLILLMEKLTNTGANFIRCIKPNEHMKQKMFEGSLILTQLQCAGMVTVLDLMQEGYPSRTPFRTLYEKYKSILPRNLHGLEPRLFCKGLFYSVGMENNDFAFGLNKVFFRPGKFAAFDTIMVSDLESLHKLVQPILKHIIKIRWRRAIWCARAVDKLAKKILWRREMLVQIQKTARMFLAVRKHRPRYMTLLKIKALDPQMREISGLLAFLKTGKPSLQEKTNDNKFRQIKLLTDKAVKNIKNQKKIMKRKDIEKAFADLLLRIEALQKQLESQKRRRLWRKVIYGAWSVQKLRNKIKYRIDARTKLQATVRMHQTVRKHRHRYLGMIRVHQMDPSINEMTEIAWNLHKCKDAWSKKVCEIRVLSERICRKIKMTAMKPNEVASLVKALLQRTNTLLDQLYKEKERQRVERLKYIWRKWIYCAVSVQKLKNKIILRAESRLIIQKTVRMFVAVRKHKPRYRGIMRIKSLEFQIDELKYMVKRLLKLNELYQCKVEDIEFDVEDAIEEIRGDAKMKRRAITKLFTDILNRISFQKKELQNVKAEQLEQQRMEEVKAQLQAEADKFTTSSKVQNFFMKKRFGSLKRKKSTMNNRRGSLKKCLAFSRSLPNLANLSDEEEDVLEEEEEEEEDGGSGSDGESGNLRGSRTSCHEIKLNKLISSP